MKESENIEQLFSDFTNKSVLVVGDIMLDRYSVGHVERMSPEAPVPVVNLDSRFDRLGGAANVALNIRRLGATPILCSVVGDDEAGSVLLKTLVDNSIDVTNVMVSSQRMTTIKHRVISGNRQIIRIDSEQTFDLLDEEFEKIKSIIDKCFDSQNIDIVVFQDYNKGFLPKRMIAHVLQRASALGIMTAVDPKKNNFHAYKGVTLFKPNLKELREGSELAIDDTFESIGKGMRTLQDELQCRYLMTTLSERGAVISESRGECVHVPAVKRNIIDVSGAGDAVLATAALCMVSGKSPELIVGLSNIAGGMVCEQPGVVPVDAALLLAEAKKIIQ